MVEICVVHDKDRVRLRIGLAIVKKLLDKALEHSSVGRYLEDLSKKNSVLSIGRQYLIPMVPGNLHQRYPSGDHPVRLKPIRLSHLNSSIQTSRCQRKANSLCR